MHPQIAIPACWRTRYPTRKGGRCFRHTRHAGECKIRPYRHNHIRFLCFCIALIVFHCILSTELAFRVCFSARYLSSFLSFR